MSKITFCKVKCENINCYIANIYANCSIHRKYNLISLCLTGPELRRSHNHCKIHCLHCHSNCLRPPPLPHHPQLPDLAPEAGLPPQRQAGIGQCDRPGGPAGPGEELRAAVLPPTQQGTAPAPQLQFWAGRDGRRVPHGLPAITVRTDADQDCQSSQHEQLQGHGAAAAKSRTRDKQQKWGGGRDEAEWQGNHRGRNQGLNRGRIQREWRMIVLVCRKVHTKTRL